MAKDEWADHPHEFEEGKCEECGEPGLPFVTVRCPACFDELFTMGPVMEIDGIHVVAMPLATLDRTCAAFVEHVVQKHTAGINDGSLPVTSEAGMDALIARFMRGTGHEN